MTVPEQIVKEIVADLSDRKGLGDEWDQIDEDVKEQIINGWIYIVNMNWPIGVKKDMR